MKRLLPVFVFGFLATIGFNFQIFSQTTERKKPKIKNFGSSLKRTPQENLKHSKKKKESKNGVDEETIKIETNLVVFDFLVITAKGFPVKGLKKEDFVVTEDDQPQEIQTFTMGNDASIPRSIVLIIDYSGSQLPYLDRSIEAAKLLVDKLRPNDLMAIVTDDVELIADYTNDKKKLKDKLDSLKRNFGEFRLWQNRKPAGKSKQFSALYSVLNEMFDEEDVRPIVIFQTDGDQFLFLKEQFGDLIFRDSYSSKRMTNFSMNDLLTVTDKSRASIYTIVPGVKLLGLSPEEKKLQLEKEWQIRAKTLGIDPKRFKYSKEVSEKAKKLEDLIKKYYPNGMPDIQEVLAQLSTSTGGWIDFLESPEQADEIYTKILDQIELRYVAGYSPTNEAKDGTRRTVKVSVKNHPEYIVWGRKTYLAPMPD